MADLKELLTKWLAKKDTQDSFSDSEIEDFLSLAAELLFLFAQYNFSGPFDDLQEFQDFVKENLTYVGDPFDLLKENGEEINPNVVLGEFLLLAKEILKILLKQKEECLVSVKKCKVRLSKRFNFDLLVKMLYKLQQFCSFLIVHQF